MNPSNCRPHPGLRWKRRGFLVTDLVAGVALAGLILALAASILKTDLQIRRTREARFRMILRFENALARAEATGADQLSEAAVRTFLEEIGRGEPGETAPVQVTVSEIPGEPGGKRIVLRSNVSQSRAGSVFLMRDLYARGPNR